MVKWGAQWRARCSSGYTQWGGHVAAARRAAGVYGGVVCVSSAPSPRIYYPNHPLYHVFYSLVVISFRPEFYSSTMVDPGLHT